MGSDPKPASAGESTAVTLKALIEGLPGLLRTTSAEVLPTERTLLETRKALFPQEQELAAQQTEAQAKIELANILGAGGETTLAADTLARKIDPEYYGGREEVAKGLISLLSGQDPNRLTGSELSNVERGLNRTNAGTTELSRPTSTGALKNALSFDDRLQQKRANFANSLAVSSSALPTIRTGTDVFSQATGRGGTSSFGSQDNQQIGQNVFGTQQDLLGAVSGFQNQYQNLRSNRRDTLDRTSQVLGSLPSD